MESNFARLVELVKGISKEDKIELIFLLEKYLIEERRDEIYQYYLQSKAELSESDHKYSNDINTLKKMLG